MANGSYMVDLPTIIVHEHLSDSDPPRSVSVTCQVHGEAARQCADVLEDNAGYASREFLAPGEAEIRT